MSFLDTIFGRTAPTTETAKAALARVEAELAAAPTRIAAAETALANVADMSDEQHAAAIAERDATRRSAARLEAQVAQLRVAFAEAEDAELVATLTARASEAQAEVDIAYPKEVAEFEKHAAALAESAARLDALDEQVAATNRAIKAAQADGRKGLPSLVVDTTRRHRFQLGRVDDDTVANTEQPCYFENGRWVPVAITSKRDGEFVLGAGEKLMNVSRRVPGREHPARSLKSPTDDLVIPATRLGGKPFWPRSAS